MLGLTLDSVARNVVHLREMSRYFHLKGVAILDFLFYMIEYRHGPPKKYLT